MLYTYTVNDPCCCSCQCKIAMDKMCAYYKYVAEITGSNVNLQYTFHKFHKLEHFFWNSIHFAKINTSEMFCKQKINK